MHTRLLTTLLATSLLAPALVFAHEAHEHTVMGVVQKIDGTSVAIKTMDEKTKAEKTVTVVVNDKTEILRGDRAVKIADLKLSERIVVKYVQTKDKGGREVNTAKQLKLAAN